MSRADELIERLGLQPHPREGGFFRETYRSEESLSPDSIGGRYFGPRSVSTAIYYLLKPGTFSALHRLKSDEVFHFYLGGPVRMLQLFPDGRSETIVLGSDLEAGQHLQVVAPRNVWQGTLLEPGSEFALLGCTVAPGFDYVDYEHASRDEMLRTYPSQAEWIQQLTHA
ncbi:MAG: cupin domain-containing protein [Gemmataceae bacterium]|nr:cupin domain-containing protein [Gemmataceae bacterium]